MPQHAEVTKELVDKGIPCALLVPSTLKQVRWYSAHQILKIVFDKNPELKDALESKLRHTFFNDEWMKLQKHGASLI